jgi:hypothetical protein
MKNNKGNIAGFLIVVMVMTLLMIGLINIFEILFKYFLVL